MQLSPTIAKAIQSRANAPGTRSFYVYDTVPMRVKIARLKTLLPASVEVFYAMKANPHVAFLNAAKKAQVTGIEIASMGEAKRALAAGFTPQQLIFTGPGKSPEELEWCVVNRLRTVHLESIVEAYRLSEICRAKKMKQEVLLRVNPNFQIHGAQASFSGDPNKLGMDENRLHDYLPDILKLDHLIFRGLHVYAASGVLKVEDLLKNCELVFNMAHDVEKTYGIRCEIIDFGGGFGVDYTESGKDFSPDAYAAGLRKLITQFGFADRQFVLELGRYLAADSGWYCTEILDIKDSLGKKQLVCAGGANHFRRPAALNINHPLAIVEMKRKKFFDRQEFVSKENIFIGGPLCSTADKLAAHDTYVEEAHVGDIAVFCLAGAYGLTMSHIEFLSHDRPEEVVLDHNT